MSEVDLWGSGEEESSPLKKRKPRKLVIGLGSFVAVSALAFGGVYYSGAVGASSLSAKVSESGKVKQISKMTAKELQSAESYYNSLVSSSKTPNAKSTKEAKKILEEIRKARSSSSGGSKKSSKSSNSSGSGYSSSGMDSTHTYVNGVHHFNGKPTDGNKVILDSVARGEIKIDEAYTDRGGLTRAGESVRNSNQASSSGGQSGRDSNVKQANDSTKTNKTQSNYAGGLDANISLGGDKEFVNDPRRSETDPRILLSEDETTLALFGAIESQVNGVAGTEVLVYSRDGVLSFSSQNYQNLEPELRKSVMETSIKRIKDSRLPSRVRNLAVKFIVKQDPLVGEPINALYSDTGSEVAEGYSWLRFAFPSLRVIFGSAMIALTALSSLSIILDMAYMTIGVLRLFLDRKGTRPRLVSPQAYEAIREAEVSSNGRYVSYLSIYFKRRMVIVILTGVVLVSYLSGSIYQFLTWVVEVIESFRGSR